MLIRFQILFTLSIFLLINSFISAQLLLQDDFGEKSDHWYWRGDGNQSIPSVKQGLLHLSLVNAINSEYCNTEIYDPTEPYGPGTQVRVRLKTSPIHNGSRGWGFWDGDLNLIALALDFDVAWVMQQGSEIDEPYYRWFLFGVATDTLTNRQTLDLNSIVDETEWHTYRIVWDYDRVSFFIDDIFIYETLDQLPNQNMRMDIWIDNRVINTENPTVYWNNDVEFSEMYVDFVEISKLEGPSIQRNITDNMVLWDSPNSFPFGEEEYLWKNYDFELSSRGEALIFLTGSAESYSESENDDDLKLILNGKDYGWDNEYALNGDYLKGGGKSIAVVKELDSGTNNLQLYSDITPFLRDVIVLHSGNGRTLYLENFNNEIENSESGKIIEFETQDNKELTVLVSGVADKNESLTIAIDDNDYKWDDDHSIIGDSLNGIPKTAVINDTISAGNHRLKITSKGKPELLSVAIYGTSILSDIKTEQNLPQKFSVSAAPNPFNPETNIYYEIPQSAYVNLRIVNILGQEIASLIDGFTHAGSHNIRWNASGKTSGIYFCILETDNYFKAEKILLLK